METTLQGKMKIRASASELSRFEKAIPRPLPGRTDTRPRWRKWPSKTDAKRCEIACYCKDAGAQMGVAQYFLTRIVVFFRFSGPNSVLYQPSSHPAKGSAEGCGACPTPPAPAPAPRR